MKAVRRLRNFSILSVSTIVWACFSNAVAQTSYRVTDLGVLHNWNQGCAMGLNNYGWTADMDGILDPSGQLATGRAVLNINGFKIDLGTLGGPNSWTNFGGINDSGVVVGLAETAVPDPNGEDICGFGTHLTCRPFIWQNRHMSGLPTLGGNNGQASAINKSGQIAGYAENTVPDFGCLPKRITAGVLWEKGVAQALPPVGTDPDSQAIGVNNKGQIVGYSGTCTTAIHAVLWENGAPTPLHDLGSATSSIAYSINDNGQIAGQVASPDGTTFYAALWQDDKIINLGTLPGDFAAFASGINSQGQVVGSTLTSTYAFSHAFIWQNGVMSDLNTLFPADSNLYATMANIINERGQISGMGTVLNGPDMGAVHAFIATPINASVGTSIAYVAPTNPKPGLPANVSKKLLLKFGLGQLGQ